MLYTGNYTYNYGVRFGKAYSMIVLFPCFFLAVSRWSRGGCGTLSLLSFTIFRKGKISLEDLFKSKKDGKDQEMIQSSTTPDPGYHMATWESN